jgi:hypothetical protein
MVLLTMIVLVTPFVLIWLLSRWLIGLYRRFAPPPRETRGWREIFTRH